MRQRPRDQVRQKARPVGRLDVHIPRLRLLSALADLRQILDEITYVYKKGFENSLELIYFL